MTHQAFITILCLGLISSVLAAPTETTTTASSTSTSPAPTTSIAPKPEETGSTQAAAEKPSSAPATDDSTKATPASMPVSSTGDMKPLNTSSFTCFGRSVGYYADTELDCKVYHFCLPGEYNQEIVYQRISYLCLNNTQFDQQALDCVEVSKITAPCKSSQEYYEISNIVLRQAILGKSQSEQQPASDSSAPKASEAQTTTTTTTAAPAI